MLGIHTERMPEGVLVVGVMEGAPAEAAGLRPGDLVVAADDRTLAGLRAPNQLLRGRADSAVRLTVNAPLSGDTRTVTVERAALTPVQRARPQPMAPLGPDLVMADGRGIDLGGQADARRAAAQRLARTDPRAAAEMVRSLLVVGRGDDLEPGLGAVDGGATWTAPLPSVWPLEAAGLDGHTQLRADDGGPPVLLAFWASWCAPCREELPELAAFAREQPTGGVRVWAINVDEELPRLQAADVAAAWGAEGLELAQDRSLARRFDVQALPTTILVGRDGGVHARVRGYGPGRVAGLTTQAVAAAAQPADAGAPIGRVFGAVEERAWHALSGARAVSAHRDQWWVDRGDAPPAIGGGADALRPGPSPSPAGRVVWTDGGLVAGDPGRLVLRAFDAADQPRWMRTLPAPLTDLESDGTNVWAAMGPAGLVVLDRSGAVVGRRDAPTWDLSPPGPDGAWAVDGDHRWRLALAPEGITATRAGPAPGARFVAADGAMATTTLSALYSARVGPDAAPRLVALRRDGQVFVLGADGAIAARLDLRGATDLAVADLDGDGRDELLVALDDLGVVAASVAAP
jgi:thiol-disulfide isomerase/thioredoxin